MIRKLLAITALAAATIGMSGVASAQPWYGPGPVVAFAGPPSIGQYHVQGRVVEFDRFHMGVRVDGRFVYVHLHQGTVINPTGLTIQPGMYVHVAGHWNGNDTFHADQIDLLN